MLHKEPMTWVVALLALVVALLAAAPEVNAADFKSIVSRHSGNCLEVMFGGQKDNVLIIQWKCSGSNQQQFDMRPVGGGFYNIVARHSGRCIDVPNGDTRDNTPVNQYGCDGSNQQQFDLRPLGSGFYNIVARHSGSCLSVDNAVIKANKLVRQFRCNGSNEQIFRLSTVTAQLPPNTAPRPANCRSTSATDETRYVSGVGYAPMTVRFCEIRKNDYRMSMFYGRPAPNGQPTGKLFFQSRLNANSQTMKGPIADLGDGTNCGPISYYVTADDNNDPSGNWLRIWGDRPERDRNCMLTGRTTTVTRVFRIQLPSGGGGVVGGSSGRANALGQIGNAIGCLINPKAPGCP